MLSACAPRRNCTSGAGAAGPATSGFRIALVSGMGGSAERARSSAVDLGLLEAAAIVDVHRLPFGEGVDHGGPSLAVAVSGLLHAAERKLHFRADRRTVHVGDPRLDVADGAHRAVHVARVDRGAEPEGGA